MRKFVNALVSFSTLLTVGLHISSATASDVPEATDEMLKLGERTYRLECASCHGVDGDGEGPGAYILDPKPRNFQLATYKIRSTPNGEVPVPRDLFDSITNGLPGSMMPSFKSLPENQRWALTHYIIRLGGIEDEEAESISVPDEPPVTDAGIAKGGELYVKLKCATCHGTDGWGDGPSSIGLKNDAKERVYPTNLTLGVNKGGSTGRDLFIRIATGLDGSPMPSYAAEAKPDEIWDLVHYVQTLAK